MAFVFRSSKRDEIFSRKEESNEFNSIKEKLELLKEKKDSMILNSSSFTSNNSKQIKAPFGVSAKKCDLPNLKSEFVPGPGTYDINNSMIKKHFNKNNTSPEMIENEEENKKRTFISQQSRFKKNQYKTDVPGPGKYFKEKFKKYSGKHNNISNQVFLYNQDVNTYEPFSTSRILSIPSKGNDFGYEINKDGNLILADDPNKDKKHTGNKNNSVGPGQYDSFYRQKNYKIGIINWNNSVHNTMNKKKQREKKEKENKNEKNLGKISQINSSQYDSNYYYSNISTEPTINNSLSILNFNKKNKTKNYFYTDVGFDRKNIEVKFSNTKIFKNDNFSRTINRSNLSPFFKLDIKPEIETQNNGEKNYPGPGAYLSLNNFNFNKDEDHQFFGSSMSRGILYPTMTNSNFSIGRSTLDSLLDIDNVSLPKTQLNKSRSFNNNNDRKTKIKIKEKKIDKNKSLIKKLDKIELIKEISRNMKKDIENNLGPGSYNPNKKIKNSFSNEIGNFGSLERRFPLFPSHDQNPGVGAYFHLQTWGPKKKNNSLDKIIPPNISKKIKEGISVNKIGLFRDKIMKENHKQAIIGQYSIENINTIDSNTKKSISVSKNQPGFGSSFKRFYIFKSQVNEENGVGKYNIKYPEAVIYQKNSAFLTSAGRDDIDNNKKKNLINKETGPGSYRNDSYFDWNKKSYNILFN